MFSKSSSTTPQEPVNPARPQKAATKAPAPGAAPSIIGHDVKIMGNLVTSGEIHLDGTVEGDVRSAILTLGEQGVVSGSITAESVIIKGTVDGEISARSVRLEKTSRVSGDLHHETVSVEAGARIDGRFVNTSAGQTRSIADGAMKLVATASDSAADATNGKADAPEARPESRKA